MRDLWFVGFLFVAIFFSLRRPYLGVTAWVWIALMAPAEWAFGFSQGFRLNLTIFVVTVLAWLFVQRPKEFRLNGTGFWILCFGAWTAVTTAFTLKVNADWVWSYWTQFLKTILLFIFIGLTVTRRLHLHTFVWGIVLSMSAYAGMEAVKYILSGGSHQITGRAGIIADRNDLAVAINTSIPLIVYLIQTTEHRPLKTGLWVLLSLNVLSIIGTGSRGGFVGLAILAFAFWLKSRRKVAWVVLALLLVPVAYQKAPEDWRERQATIATAATEDSSFIGRLWAWKISSLIALDHPITGGGFQAVTEPSLWSYYAPMTPDFPPVSTPPIPGYIMPKAAHNIYFQVLGDHGFVGLGIFLMFLFLALLSTLRNSRAAGREGVLWFQYLSSALTLSLIGFGITGANVSLAYFDLLYALLGIITVMSVRREELLGIEAATPSRGPSSQGVMAGRG